jgi:peptide/nickel transport system permease protein
MADISISKRSILTHLGTAVLGFVALVHAVFVALVWPSGGAVRYLYSAICRQQAEVDCGPDAEQAKDIVEVYLNIRPRDPLPEQYLDYMTALLTGDLGKSIWYSKPVTGLLTDALLMTLALLLLAGGGALVAGVALGVYGQFGTHRSGRIGAQIGGSLMAATPAVLPAALITYGLTVALTGPMSWREAQRIADLPDAPNLLVLGTPARMALAVVVLALVGAGPWVLDTCRELYSKPSRAARLRGLSTLRTGRTAWRANPSRLTARAAYAWVWLCSAVPLVKYLFHVRGLGWYLVKAVTVRDYPLLLGSFLLLGTVALLGVLAVELLAAVLDTQERERWWSRSASKSPSVPFLSFD